VVVAGPFTTLAGGTYSLSSAFADGDTCTVSASKEGDLPGTIPVLIATGINSYPNSDILLAPDPNADVLFSLNTDSLSGIADGARITSWSCAVPVGASMPAFNTWNNGLPELGPIVETLGGVKWEQNTRAVYSEVPPPTVHTRQDGFQLGGDYTTPIAVNGVTVVTTVRPVRKAISDPWTSIVDVFYRNLILGIRNDNGELLVVRNNTTFTGPAIPDGQKTILALVMQSDGQFKVYANGAEVMNETSTSPMTALTPGSAGHEKRIRVGRGWDDWTVFNGNIADTVVYKSAISDGQRTALEASLATKFGITLPSGGNDYADWAIANAPGQTPGEDYNNDGVQNGIAYFMGATGPVTNPGLTGSNTVTWPMSATFSGTWQVQTSSNLATWTPADPQPVPAGGNLAYTLPSGPDKLFVRLVVTPN
jgi:hypothetical protein